MTDLEITRLCAAAMGWEFTEAGPAHGTVWSAARYIKDGRVVEYEYAYDPLHDDAQAMALVRKLKLDILAVFEGGWNCEHNSDFDRPVTESFSKDLNRAICETAAKMQAELGKVK